MDELDEMVLRKRRDRMNNRQSAPQAFLFQFMFEYQAPQPIPGSRDTAQFSSFATPSVTPRSDDDRRSNINELRETMQRGGPEQQTEARAEKARDRAAEKRAEVLAASRGQATVKPTAERGSGKSKASVHSRFDVDGNRVGPIDPYTAPPKTTARNPDEAADHNERSKRQMGSSSGVVRGTADSVGFDTR
jgi:hypothetical protein